MAQSRCLITLDPGEHSGLAFFQDATLVWCGLNELRVWSSASGPYNLFWEKPQINGQTKGKDPNAIVTEAVSAGRWLERIVNANGPPAREWFAFPVSWKASVDKTIHNARVLEKLTPAERALIPKLAKSKLHNVIDAIGLGLFALGRMGRGA